MSSVRGAAAGHEPGHAARPPAAGVPPLGRGLHLPLGRLRHAAGEVELLTNFSEVSQCSVKVKTVNTVKTFKRIIANERFGWHRSLS